MRWEYIHIYIYYKKVLQPCYHGYEFLKSYSDIFQLYFVINQQRVTCLELAHIFNLRLRTSKLLSVILYRLKLLALVDYHLVQYPQHFYEKIYIYLSG